MPPSLGRETLKSLLFSPPADSLLGLGNLKKEGMFAQLWEAPQRRRGGEGQDPIIRVRRSWEKTDSLCQPGLFSHIHTPGCLKVTSNQTFTGQELPLCYLEIR